MGHVNVKLRISNVQTKKGIEEIALVDTGATFTVLPRRLAKELELPIVAKRKVRTAAAIIEVDESYAEIRVDGRITISPVVISDSPTIEKPLVGVITLEALSVVVDPVSKKLKETEALLLFLV